LKTRRHHNNKGQRQIKRGKTGDQVKRLALKAGVNLRIGDTLHTKDGPLKIIASGTSRWR